MLYSDNYDMLLVGNDSIDAYNIGDKSVTKVCSFIDSDINAVDVLEVCELEKEKFLAIMSDNETGANTVVILEKVPAKEAMSKETLTLGCYYLDYDVQTQIINFNKKNKKYRIAVVDYSKFDTDDNQDAGLQKMNTDIISGGAPDIILANSNMPMESFMVKGIFEPLESFFENDSELSISDYLPNVVDSFKYDDHIYYLVPSFQVYTVAGKKSVVGTQKGWTFDEVQKIAKEQGIENQNIFGPTSRDSFLTMATYLDIYSFIDWDEHKCSFNDGSFARLLEFAGQLPKDTSDDVLSQDTSGWYRSGKSLASMSYIYNFSYYRNLLRGIFGEEITMKGFPGAKGGGSCLESSNQICMSSSSKNKQGCWEFMRLFITKEAQDKVTYAFPVLKSSFEAQADSIMKKNSESDDDDMFESETMTIDGQEIKMEPLTQAERDEAVSFITSVTEHISYNNQITNIIEEETAPYFEGQKIVEQVCDIIQSRVSIYVNENS
jgi:ABC-type glycerol-3-phosphate transport system substrate-binding protein